MPSNILINGHRFDFSSVEINVNGRIFTGVTEISYSNSLEPGVVRGTSAQPIGRTRGEASSEASFTMLKSDYSQLIRALDPSGRRGYMERSFDINVSFREDFELPLQNDFLRGCRISQDEDSHSTGSEAIVVSVTLSVMRVFRNGQSPTNLDR